MNLSVVLREVGLTPEDYDSAKIPIILFDGKNRISEEDDIRFNEKLFVRNSYSFKAFYLLLKNLEKMPIKPESINVRIDEGSVILFYQSPYAQAFSRKAPP